MDDKPEAPVGVEEFDRSEEMSIPVADDKSDESVVVELPAPKGCLVCAGSVAIGAALSVSVGSIGRGVIEGGTSGRTEVAADAAELASDTMGLSTEETTGGTGIGAGGAGGGGGGATGALTLGAGAGTEGAGACDRVGNGGTLGTLGTVRLLGNGGTAGTDGK